MTFGIGLGFTREAYLGWREQTAATTAFWERKRQLALDMLNQAKIAESDSARGWFETSVEVCELNQQWNARFDLLMLLRTRASGALG